MKYKYLILFFLSSIIYSQTSDLTIGDGSELFVSLGSEICSEYITVNIGGSFIYEDPSGVCSGAIIINAPTIEDALNVLKTSITDLPINSGLKNALTKKIDQVLTKYNEGNLNVVTNVLTAFINQVNDLIAEGKLTNVDGQIMINYANFIINNLYTSLVKDHGNKNYVADPEDDQQLPLTQFDLSQNYPNPFNPSTTIRYQLPKESKVVIKIYNILGSEVMELLNEQKEAGVYEVELNTDNFSSGTYIYRISADNFVQTRKMILLK